MTVKISEALMAEWDTVTQRLDARGYEVETFQCVMAESFASLLDRLKREEAALSKGEQAKPQPAAVTIPAAATPPATKPTAQPQATGTAQRQPETKPAAATQPASQKPASGSADGHFNPKS